MRMRTFIQGEDTRAEVRTLCLVQKSNSRSRLMGIMSAALSNFGGRLIFSTRAKDMSRLRCVPSRIYLDPHPHITEPSKPQTSTLDSS